MTRYRCTLCGTIYDASSLAMGQFQCPADGAPLVPMREPSTPQPPPPPQQAQPLSESVDDLEVVDSDDDVDDLEVFDDPAMYDAEPVPAEPWEAWGEDGQAVEAVPAEALDDSDPVPIDPFAQEGAAGGPDPFGLREAPAPPLPPPPPPPPRKSSTASSTPAHPPAASRQQPPAPPKPRTSSHSSKAAATPSGRRPSEDPRGTPTGNHATGGASTGHDSSASRPRPFKRPPSMRQIRNRGERSSEAGSRSERTAGAPPQAETIGEAANRPLRKTPTSRGVSVSQLAEDPDEFPPGPFGPFELLRILGRGAMGTVYLANWVDEPEAPELAVKVLSLARTTETRHRKRFQREAEICRRLRHPNLVEVYDVGEADGRLYMAMELIHGRPISSYIKDQGTLDPQEVVPLLVQALKGVAEFHAAGIIHRDLKPDNILVRDDGHAKVTDFGLARLQEPDATKLTAAGKAVGTPYFMAPEQVLQPETVDHRVDIYAIGITLYHSLTAAYPYDGRRANDVLLNIAREQPIHIWSRRADLPQSIAQVVMRLIARDPTQRYTDANAAAQGLQEALEMAYG